MKRLLALSVLLILFSYPGFGQSIILDGSFTHSNSVWFSILTVDNYWASDVGTNTQEGPVTFADAIGGCVGLRFYSPTDENWQEYIYQNITGAMKADTTYLVSLKYRLAPACSTGTDFIGVGFLKGYTNQNQITETVLRAKTPEVFQSGPAMINNLEYKEMKGYYTSTGDENFFAIGAFKTDNQIAKLPTNTNYPGYPNNQATILYFIDDVKIIPCNDYPPDPLPEELTFCEQEIVHLSVPSINGATYLWSNGDTTSQTDVLADNQYVWIEITKNGCMRSDTIKLRAFSGNFDLGEDRNLCSSAEFPIVLQVDSNPGEQILWSTGFTGPTFGVSESGTYWAEKSQGNCNSRDTITITELSGSARIYPNPVKDQFAITHTDHANILNIQTEDGKWIFEGVASMESMGDFVGNLAPAVYFITTDIEGCILKERIVKMNE